MKMYLATLLAGFGVSLSAAIAHITMDEPDVLAPDNATWNTADRGLSQTSSYDLVARIPPECGDDCDSCTMALAGNGGRIEVRLAAVEFDGTDSTFTYHVCQDQTSQNLSHWVVGLSPTCCARLLEAMGGTSTTGTCRRDPTTGLYGLKFETGSGVPICDGVTCGEPGDVFTLTFSGNIGTDCVTIAGKIDGGDSTAYGCVLGPACDHECQVDADCDDGLFCNGYEACIGGFCYPDTSPDCNDGIDCTDDSCDEENDQCVNAPNHALCNDGNVCTDDSCNPASGCVYVNNTDPCDDGNACTTADTCSGGACVGGPPPDCDDQNVCTDDSCDPATGCVHVNNTDPCDDGNACTTDDMCSDGTCVGGPPLDCDDQNVCTDDSCDPASGCVYMNNADPCDDGDACTTADTCSGGVCVGGPPLDCDDQNVCTDDSCDPASGCVYVNNTDPCDDGDPCTINDICTDGQCVGMLDPENSDNDCAPDACDVCPGRPDCRFDPERSCPDAAFHVAVLQEPSDLSCGEGRPDCTDTDPPVPCEEVLGCGSSVFVEIWVTKFSPDLAPAPPYDPGIACAYVDLVSYVPVAAEIGFEYGAAFDAGSAFESGTFDGDGGIMDLGACSTASGGVGLWPEWVLLARIELRQGQGEGLGFELQESALFSTSVFGEGSADPVDYGERCDSNVFCRAHMYDVDQDCFVGPGDLACFAGCFGLCPDDPEYNTACCGGSCDCANYVKCSEDDCVGPEDFAFWVTCWLKYCDDPVCILVPGDICDGGPTSVEGLPPLPSDSLLRNLGLEPPSDDWKGYRRGILREWQRLEAESRAPKEYTSDREYLRKRRGR